MGLKGFDVGSVYMEIDGQKIQIEAGNITTEWETNEEVEPFNFSHEGTLSIRDFQAPLSFRHMDKFKSVRMGGKRI